MAQWWFSSTDRSLYSTASGWRVAMRNGFITPGWSVSWTIAAKSVAHTKSGSLFISSAAGPPARWSIRSRHDAPSVTSTAWRNEWNGLLRYLDATACTKAHSFGRSIPSSTTSVCSSIAQ